ncbi:MAG TPA: integration host factor subunit alpha [Clostridiales bacterium]|nr:integration host factor subunit alpha [Clostridiales bacterium]
MNKSELINAMSTASGLSKKNCSVALDAYVGTIENALKSGEKVVIVGFGTFAVKNRAARKGRNPQTKKEIKIPASKAPVFKAGKSLKMKVNVKGKK